MLHVSMWYNLLSGIEIDKEGERERERKRSIESKIAILCKKVWGYAKLRFEQEYDICIECLHCATM